MNESMPPRSMKRHRPMSSFLIEQLRSGNEAAFGVLIDRYHQVLAPLIWRRCT